jgi:CheY-like chemotaxis protein
MGKMAGKPIILLVEDDPESANDYKKDIEALIDVTVITVSPPPTDLLNLIALVNEHQADAVILDEVLQHHSDAAYMGIDAFDHLRRTFPTLPVDILTGYPHGSELKGRGLSAENLVRKRELDEDEEYKNAYLQELTLRMERYRQRQDDRQIELVPSNIVTKEFVESLARLHFETEESVEQIIWVRSDDDQEIRLIEVNRITLPTGDLQVFRFAPSEDVPFPQLIADVTPAEWDRIQSGEIPLPQGWDLETTQVFPRSEVLLRRGGDVG